MDHQSQQHGGENVEKKKRVTFWNPEDMITPQIIQTTPDHPALIHPAMSQNADLRNHQYPSYNTNNQESKYKSDNDYRHQASRNGNSSGESSSSPQKKPKKEIDSSKPYKCTQCEYSFNRRDHLTRHSLVHSKLKPYHCNFCNKDFTRNDHLRRHQQRVHGEEASLNDVSQRFVCQECKAVFSSSGHLRAHIENKHHSDFGDFLTHTEDPLRKNSSQSLPYVIVDGKKRPVCQLCNKSFAKKDHLTRHINSLHNNATSSAFESFTPEQSFNCQMCGKRFSRPEFLRRHIEDVHSHSTQMDLLNQLNPSNPYNLHQGNSHHENGSHSAMFVPPPPHLTGGFFGFENTPMSSSASKVSQQQKNTSAPLKEHKCSICNKNFSRKYHLTRHQKSLHGGHAFNENN